MIYKHEEPYELRDSRKVAWEPKGEIPLGDSIPTNIKDDNTYNETDNFYNDILVFYVDLFDNFRADK